MVAGGGGGGGPAGALQFTLGAPFRQSPTVRSDTNDAMNGAHRLLHAVSYAGYVSHSASFRPTLAFNHLACGP